MRASASPRLFAAVLVLCTGLLALSPASLSAQDSAFSYQGHLVSNGVSANGSFDMQFRLMTSAGGETTIGTAVELPAVIVTDGVFTVTLGFEGPALGVPGVEDRWIEVSVRPSGSMAPRTVLAPRQKLLSVPFATRAGTADYATAAEQLTGQIAQGNIPAGTITRDMLVPGVLPLPTVTASPTVPVQPNEAYRGISNDLQVFALPASAENGTQVEITGQNLGGWTTFAPWTPAFQMTGFSRVDSDGTGQILYSGGLNQPLRRSTNGGFTWSDIRPLTSVTALQTSTSGSTVAYVDSTLGRVFTSQNDGQMWNSLQNRDSHTLTQVAVSPNGAYVAAAGAGTWLSLHDASGTMVYGGEITDTLNWSAVAVASDRSFFAAVDGGIIRLINPEGAETTYTLPNAWKALACNESGTVLHAVGTNTRIHRIVVSGMTSSISGPVANYTSIDVSPDGRYVIAGTDNGQVVMSNDYGNTFYTAGTTANWTDVTLSADGIARYGAATGQGILRSIGNHSGANDETVRLMYDTVRGWVPVRSTTEVALNSQVGSLGTQVTSLDTRVGVVEDDLIPRVGNLESGLTAVNSLTQSLAAQAFATSNELDVVQDTQIVQNNARIAQDAVHSASLTQLQNQIAATAVAVADKVDRIGDIMNGPLSVPTLSVGGASGEHPLDVRGQARFRDPLIIGSGTGTSQSPQFGVITRRINSTNYVVGQVVARGEGITLERNNTASEFVLNYDDSMWDTPKNFTITFQGLRSNGTTVQGVLETSGVGSITLFSGLTDVVWMTCTFGDPYNNSHSTEVRMSRSPNDFFWTGFLTSTFNQ